MLDDLIKQLIAKTTKRRMLNEGTYLFHQGGKIRSIFIVEEGLVELIRHQRDGAFIILQRATNHTVLAEASMYYENYHCDGIVAVPSSVFELSKNDFLKYLQGDEAFSNLWSAHLAKEVQSARYRSEILSRKTVAERLDGWLVWKGISLPAKGLWKSIAVQIGVSPEALYRELAKRRSK